MLLKDLFEKAGVPLPVSGTGTEVKGVCSDSRRLREGEIFVAIPGLCCDGLSHVGEAIARGACFVVAEREVLGVPHRVVNNAREVLAKLLDAWYDHPAAEMRLIGITGTNGKTSCAAMLYAILREAKLPCGMVGTLGCFSLSLS